MSGRSHVDVSERRLRPIYDCLDNGNNKKAIQEADKVLKKQKDLLCAKALKALALHRLGRRDESTAILKEVHSHNPTDEASLQAMAICYREMHRLELIADMYENASKAKPNSEEILSALFMSYVRLGDYKKQQQTAMALHRTRPQKNPYYFWAVMSIVMQSYDAKENLAQAMFLPLAERMTSKYIQENKIQAEAEVQLYLIIVESLGKYEEALKTLQGSLGERLVSEPLFQEKKSAEYYTKMKKWPNVNAIYRRLLLENIDHWDFYNQYFASAFEVIDAKWSPEEDDSVKGEVDNSLEKVVTFVLGQKAKATECLHLPRGPFLAELQLIKELRRRSLHVSEQLGEPIELLKTYFVKFGDKLCCYGDMKSFLELMTREEQLKFVDDLCNETGVGKQDEGISFAKDKKSMQRHLCILQLSSYCGLHQQLEIDAQMALVNELLQRYEHGLQFGKGILVTDLQPCDNYLLLAAHILINIWSKTGDNKILWQTIGQLELGLRNSPSNFQMKIILIRLYGSLGAFGPCISIYESMEIKHIQHDTLGYIVSSHVERLGHFTTARTIHDAILKFFTINQKDTTEYLISSYKFGSFTKIREFVKFRERLQNSLQFAASRTDAMVLDLLLDTESMQSVQQIVKFMGLDPEKDDTEWDKLEDNRDFDVITSWQPGSATLSDELKQKSYNEEVAWIRLRDLTVRCLSAAVGLTKKQLENPEHNLDNHATSNGHIATDGINVAKSLLGQLQDHITACQQGFSQPTTYPLEGPFRTRLSTYLNLNLSEPFTEALQCLVYIYSATEALEKTDPKMEEKLGKKLGQCVKDLVEIQTKVLREGDACRKSLQPDVIENLTLIAEVLGQLAIIAGVCHELVKTVKPQTRKGKKKKESPSSGLLSVSNGVRDFIKCLTEAVKGLHDVVQETDADFLSSKMAELKLYEDAPEMLLLTEEIKDKVTEKVLQSYQQTAKELLKFLATKLRFLSTLH